MDLGVKGFLVEDLRMRDVRIKISEIQRWVAGGLSFACWPLRDRGRQNI